MSSVSEPQKATQRNNNNMAPPNEDELLAARAAEMTDTRIKNAPKPLPEVACTRSSDAQCRSPATAQFEHASTSLINPNATACPPQEVDTGNSQRVTPSSPHPSVLLEQVLQPPSTSASAQLSASDAASMAMGNPPIEASEQHQQNLPMASINESQVSSSTMEKNHTSIPAADNRIASSANEVDHVDGPPSTTSHDSASMPRPHPLAGHVSADSSVPRPKYNVRVAQRDYKAKGGIFPWSMRHRNTRKPSIGRADKATKAEISRKRWNWPRPSSRIPLFPYGDVLSQPHALVEPEYYSGVMKRYRVEKDARRASRLQRLEADRKNAPVNAKQHVPAYIPSSTHPGSYEPNPDKRKAFAAWLAQSRLDAMALEDTDKVDGEAVQRWQSSHKYHEKHPWTPKDRWVVDFHVHHMPGDLSRQFGNGHFVVCAKRGSQEAYWMCTFQFSSNGDISDDHKRTYNGQFNHVSTSFFDYRRDPGFSGHFTVDARPSELKYGRKTNTMIDGQFEVYWGNETSRPYRGQFSAFGGNCRCNFFRRRRGPSKAKAGTVQSGATGQSRGILATAFEVCSVQ